MKGVRTDRVQRAVLTGCAGKSSYPDFTVARRYAEQTSRNHDEAFAPYRCHHCHWWHVGGSKRLDQRRRSERRMEIE